jgi:hypothetical protein
VSSSTKAWLAAMSNPTKAWLAIGWVAFGICALILGVAVDDSFLLPGLLLVFLGVLMAAQQVERLERQDEGQWPPVANRDLEVK